MERRKPTPKRLVWSHHAAEKLHHVTKSWRAVREAIASKIAAEDWTVWWELDPNGRELKTFLAIGDGRPTGQTWAIVTPGAEEDGTYVVRTVLSTQQYAFSVTHCWHKSPRAVLESVEPADLAQARGLSPPAAVLKHSPFSKLRRAAD